MAVTRGVLVASEGSPRPSVSGEGGAAEAAKRPRTGARCSTLSTPRVAMMAGGIALTLARSLPMFVAGLWALTFGFFAAYDVASGWVALRRREAAGRSSRRLRCTRPGITSARPSVARWPVGAWDDGARPAVVLLSGGLTVAAFVLALVLGGSYGPQPS